MKTKAVDLVVVQEGKTAEELKEKVAKVDHHQHRHRLDGFGRSALLYSGPRLMMIGFVASP